MLCFAGWIAYTLPLFRWIMMIHLRFPVRGLGLPRRRMWYRFWSCHSMKSHLALLVMGYLIWKSHSWIHCPVYVDVATSKLSMTLWFGSRLFILRRPSRKRDQIATGPNYIHYMFCFCYINKNATPKRVYYRPAKCDPRLAGLSTEREVVLLTQSFMIYQPLQKTWSAEQLEVKIP